MQTKLKEELVIKAEDKAKAESERADKAEQ